MKNNLLTLIALLAFTTAFSQQMHVKNSNFYSFRADEKRVPAVLEKKSSDAAKSHPEYGILPYNAQCSECVELIDKRTLNNRQFIDPKNAGHTYSQASYFPLHYKKSENDIWRTIDKRLKPNPSQQGIYEALNQPVPTKCDLNKLSTSLNINGFEFEFNRNLSAYFFDDNTLYTQKEAGNYTDKSIGEEGLLVKNIWKGINMQQKFREGEIETDYVINAPLTLPLSKGWLVIEDHFTLPAGYNFEESKSGEHVENGYYRGDYLLRNDQGDTLVMYKTPVYVDGKAFGMHGFYKLLKTSNDYTLQMLVPVEWLLKADNTYPLLIDPIVRAVCKIGNFQYDSLGVSANLGFTSMALGSCDYHMTNVIVPGKSLLTNAYVDLEYQLTYDNTCGTPHELPPYCTFTQVTQEIINDTCHTTTGLLGCHPAMGPYTGVCTTDSNLVPGARAVFINSFVPNYLSCLPPQCADYNLSFTLKNRDSICGDVCGYLCANGHMWQMTIEAREVEDTISQNLTTVCPGQPIIFTSRGTWGVAPYHYAWSQNAGLSYDTIFGTPNYTVHPLHSGSVYCVISDTCGQPQWSVDSGYFVYTHSVLYDTVLPAPVVTIHGDTLFSTPGRNYEWYINDTLIAGANGQWYIPTRNGLYSVQIPEDSCPSAQILYPQVSGINTIISGASALLIIPNPSNGNFIIRYTCMENIALAHLRLYDAEGRTVITKSVGVNAGENSYSFEGERKLAAGIYWVELQAANKLLRQKLLIE